MDDEMNHRKLVPCMLFCGIDKIHAGRMIMKYREIIHVNHDKLEWFGGVLIIHILGIVH